MQCGVGTVTSHRVRLSTSTWRNIPNICCCLCVLSISTLYSRSALFHNHNGTADTITIYCDAFCKAPIIVKTKAANPWSISIWINEFESESDSVRRFIYWIIGVGSRLHINICWSSGEIFPDPWWLQLRAQDGVQQQIVQTVTVITDNNRIPHVNISFPSWQHYHIRSGRQMGSPDWLLYTMHQSFYYILIHFLLLHLCNLGSYGHGQSEYFKLVHKYA